MRITFLLPPASMSGGIRVVAIHAKALVAKGHQVVLVSPPLRKPGAKARLKAILRGSGLRTDPAREKSHLDGLGLDHRVLDRSRPPVDADVPDADVAVATWWETAEWLNALGAQKGAKAYFIQHHEVHAHLPVERVRATYRLPLHKIVIARWLRDVMHAEYGDADVDLVPNSVDHNQFHAEPRGKQNIRTAGFLFSSLAFKGVDVTLRAIELLRERFPGLRVISFGAERPEGYARWDRRIEFHHLPPQHLLAALYSQCDVWIMASRTEGFNLPAMEAMACRTPVVSTKAGWPEEAVVTGRNGVLVDVDDVNALAQGAEWILDLPDEKWRAISNNAHGTVASSSWGASTTLLERALEHARKRAAEGALSIKKR